MRKNSPKKTAPTSAPPAHKEGKCTVCMKRCDMAGIVPGAVRPGCTGKLVRMSNNLEDLGLEP